MGRLPLGMSAKTPADPESWRAIFERSGCVMLLEDDDAKLVRVNAAACRVLKRSREELEGASIDDFTVWPAADARAAQRRALRRDGVMVVQRRFSTGDGGTVNLDLCGTAGVLPSLNLFVGVPPGTRREPRPESRGKPLSPREREVVDLLADGLSGVEVAHHLVLSPQTVRTHIRNAMDKLGARTRAHLVAMRMHDRFFHH
jgi:PAS domain S-box-containing protein